MSHIPKIFYPHHDAPFVRIINAAINERASLLRLLCSAALHPAGVRGVILRVAELNRLIDGLRRVAPAARWAEGTMHGGRQVCSADCPNGKHGDNKNV